MTLASLHQRIICNRQLWSLPVRAVLRVSSTAYAAAIRSRNSRYDNGTGVTRVPVPVISVGNITTGGTGKTPLVVHVAQALQARDLRVAVLSRGYKSASGQVADEVRLLQEQLPGVSCIQNPDRVAAAEQSIAEHGIQAIILDDGFQHRRLARDLDIVTIDATCPFGHGYLLPRGLLREPLTSLARAGLIVLTRTDQVPACEVQSLEVEIRRHAESVPIVHTVHRPAKLESLKGRMPGPAPGPGEPVLCFAGIGNPASFTQTVASLGYEVRANRYFDDHHRYSQGHLRQLVEQSRRVGARWLLTTEKDAARLRDLPVDGSVPIFVLPIRIELLGDGATILEQALARALASHQQE